MLENKAGIFLVDKPSGISSARAISIIKRNLKIKKIGHAGTLDPMATGLLVVLVGRATKLARFAEGGIKRYSGRILLGFESDSDDITGNLTKNNIPIPEWSIITEQVKEFLGKISQCPPAISAIKVNGQRAYRLARQGQQVQLKSRTVDILDFQVFPETKQEISFVVECSKGTYIRSLARDLGVALKCGACLSALRREVSLPFTVTSAKSPELIAADDLIDWRMLQPEWPAIDLETSDAERFLAGDLRTAQTLLNNLQSDYVIYQNSNMLPLGILQRDGDTWKILVNMSEA